MVTLRKTFLSLVNLLDQIQKKFLWPNIFWTTFLRVALFNLAPLPTSPLLPIERSCLSSV